MDDFIWELYEEWLREFAKEPLTSDSEATWREDALREIEAKIARTPAAGVKGLVVKLALHCFLQTENAGSRHADSAYRDLVRLANLDPLAELNATFQKRIDVVASGAARK